MTKKHFKALAAALKFERPAPNWSENKKGQWNQCVLAVARTSETLNPLFDYDRFIEACGGLF